MDVEKIYFSKIFLVYIFINGKCKKKTVVKIKICTNFCISFWNNIVKKMRLIFKASGISFVLKNVSFVIIPFHLPLN